MVALYIYFTYTLHFIFFPSFLFVHFVPWYRASLIGWRRLEQSKASKASNVTALEQQLRDSEAKAVVAQELEVPSSADSDAELE